MLARLDREEPERAGTGDVTVTLLAASLEHDLTEKMAARTTRDQILLLVSVPAGSEVQLELTEGSRTATFDLRYGEVTEDDAG